MEKPPPCKIHFFSILFSVLVFASCTEDSIAIVSSDAKIVFDFEDEGNPVQRLSVFVKPSSNVRRIESIDVKFSDGKEMYSWKIENPILFQSGKESWAGYPHLEASANLKKFPKGSYDFECVDAAGNSEQGIFFVDYDENLLGEFSSENFLGEKWSEQVALYSGIGELLVLSKNEKKYGDEKFFQDIKDSNFLRHIYQARNVICLGPKVFKGGVDENGQ